MKKLSDVSKIVGVSRRTLQEYDRIGLLKPTTISENGYWYYDDISIWKLMTIQIFREVGYDRKTIKNIFNSSTLNLIDEYNGLILNLEEKRKRIEGMINTIKIMRLTTNLPESTVRAMSNADVGRIYRDKSFISHFKDAVSNSTEYTESETDEAEKYMPFIYSILAIGFLMRKPHESKEVQDAVDQTFRYMLELVKEEEDFSEEELSEAEVTEAFFEGIQDIVSSTECLEMIEKNCGEGASAYIIRSVQVFCERKEKSEE